MKAVTRILAGGVTAAALVCAAPAAAQYYPVYGGGIGQAIGQIFGGGGYGYNGSGYNGGNQQAIVNQCAAAVQQRLSGGYGYNGGYNGGSNNGLTVRGVATSGRYAAYGNNGYGAQAPVDLTWRCKADYRGYIADIDISPAQRNYGYGNNYQPYNQYDYSQYGYRRY